MADDKNAAGAAGGDTGVEDKTLLGGDDAVAGAGDSGSAVAAGDTGAGAAGDDNAPSWREDWRDRLAGEDEAFGKHLKRFKEPETFAKSYRALQKELSERRKAPTLPENATEEDIAAYRKEVGVPEQPEGYGFAFPAELKPSAADTATVGAFQKFLHDQHISANDPGAKVAFDFYVRARAAEAEATQEARVQNLTELKSEWKGREFNRNIRMTQDWLAKTFEGDEDVLDDMLAAKMPDGVTRVGDHAKILKRLNAAALAVADEVALISGDIGGGGKSPEDRKNELLDKSATGKLTKTEDAELNKLFEYQVAQENRAGRSRVRA